MSNPLGKTPPPEPLPPDEDREWLLWMNELDMYRKIEQWGLSLIVAAIGAITYQLILWAQKATEKTNASLDGAVWAVWAPCLTGLFGFTFLRATNFRGSCYSDQLHTAAAIYKSKDRALGYLIAALPILAGLGGSVLAAWAWDVGRPDQFRFILIIFALTLVVEYRYRKMHAKQKVALEEHRRKKAKQKEDLEERRLATRPAGPETSAEDIAEKSPSRAAQRWKEFLRYWADNIRAATEGHDLVMYFLTVSFLFAGLVLLSADAFFLFEASANTIGIVCLWGGALSFIGWCLLWLPFQRHAQHESFTRTQNQRPAESIPAADATATAALQGLETRAAKQSK